MDNNNNNNNKNGLINGDNLISWVVAIICLFAFWPVGLYLIYKLVTNSSKQVKRNQENFSSYWTTDRYRSSTSSTYTPPAQNSTSASHATQNSTSARTAGANPVTPGKNTTHKTPKATGAVALLILAIIFLLIGISTLFNFFDNHALFDLLSGLFFTAGGCVSLFARGLAKRKARRLSKYISVMGFDDAKTVAEIAEATGFSTKLVRKDLNYLAERGYFGEDAYFDIGLDSIVLSSETAEAERKKRYAQEQHSAAEAQAEADPYMSVLKEFHRLGDSITDPVISEKVKKLEETTAKIFKAVEDNPGKASNIRKFMDYYLPSTNKLLKSYNTLEKQGISGKNITATKQDIERVLDSLVDGYSNQLDQLFDSDALDISSDIDVLENMLKRDGLTDEGDVFQSGSH